MAGPEEPEMNFDNSVGQLWAGFGRIEEALEDIRASQHDPSRPLHGVDLAEARVAEAEAYNHYTISRNELGLALATHPGLTPVERTVWARNLGNTGLVLSRPVELIVDQLDLLRGLEAKAQPGEPVLVIEDGSRMAFYLLDESGLRSNMVVDKVSFADPILYGGDILTGSARGAMAIVDYNSYTFPRIHFDDVWTDGVIISPTNSQNATHLEKILNQGQEMSWYEYDTSTDDQRGPKTARICIGEEDIKMMLDEIDTTAALSVLILAQSNGRLLDTQSPMSNHHTKIIRGETMMVLYLKVVGANEIDWRQQTLLGSDAFAIADKERKRQDDALGKWPDAQLKALLNLLDIPPEDLADAIASAGKRIPGYNELFPDAKSEISNFVSDLYVDEEAL